MKVESLPRVGHLVDVYTPMGHQPLYILPIVSIANLQLAIEVANELPDNAKVPNAAIASIRRIPGELPRAPEDLHVCAFHCLLDLDQEHFPTARAREPITIERDGEVVTQVGTDTQRGVLAGRVVELIDLCLPYSIPY